MPTDLSSSVPVSQAWVRTIDGAPCIRKQRLFWVAIASISCHLLMALGVSAIFQTPFRLGLPVAISTATVAGLVVMVELQRQRVLRGRWRFQIGLGAGMTLVTLAAIFFALVMQMIRADQQGHAANQRAREKLAEIVGPGGSVSISTVEGKGISCHVVRRDFGDRDLMALIACAAERGSGTCRISYLLIEETAITPEGLACLADCPDLAFLALPAVELSDTTVNWLSQCKKLKHLLIPVTDSKNPEQLEMLRQRLPQLRINGKP